ncbi:MAG: hypothetical protein JNN07_15760 [Verrucomicrobiales bacterium]|nr:hypothetical protein [Verrucomicrobiales bacterium]
MTNAFRRLRLRLSVIALCLAAVDFRVSAAIFEPINPLGCSYASLREAVTTGGFYRFTCNATIEIPATLIVSKRLYLDAAGHDVTLSGGGLHQILVVQFGVACELRGIRLRDGVAQRGGAISSRGGELTLRDVRFENNLAQGVSSAGTEGLGGAIDNMGGTINALRCQWTGNLARGGDGLVLSEQPSSVRFGATSARAGAIYNDRGVVQLVDCQFVSNAAQGGRGMSEPFQHRGADASGGAIESSGQLDVVGCTFSGNEARGGEGRFSGSFAYSGSGQGSGGAMANHGVLTALNSTWYRNTVTARLESLPQGPLGEGQAAPHRGGALFSDSESNTVSIVHATFVGNVAAESFGSRPGNGGAIASDHSSVRISRSVFAHAAGSSNFAGTVIDVGYNLSSDDSGHLQAGGSRSGLDPRLGTLEDNGGPTWTVSLLADSPAIDAAPHSEFVVTDQRGVSRPQGVGFDLGAFERRNTSSALVLRWVRILPPNGVLEVVSTPGARLQLFAARELKGPWTLAAEAMADAQGRAVIETALAGPGCFFRVSQ